MSKPDTTTLDEQKGAIRLEPKYIAYQLNELVEGLMSVHRGRKTFEATQEIALKAAVVIGNLKSFMVKNETDATVLAERKHRAEMLKAIKRDEIGQLLNAVGGQPSFFAEREFQLNQNCPLVRERGVFVLEVGNVKL